MIIYRPHRGSLDDAMAEAKEFKNRQEMKKYIVEQWGGNISFEDIVISKESHNDDRIGWKDTKNICSKRFGEEDNIALYGFPQCIGMCATNYKRDISFPNLVLQKIIDEYCKNNAMELHDFNSDLWSNDEIIGIILSRFMKKGEVNEN